MDYVARDVLVYYVQQLLQCWCNCVNVEIAVVKSQGMHSNNDMNWIKGISQLVSL